MSAGVIDVAAGRDKDWFSDHNILYYIAAYGERDRIICMHIDMQRSVHGVGTYCTTPCATDTRFW